MPINLFQELCQRILLKRPARTALRSAPDNRTMERAELPGVGGQPPVYPGAYGQHRPYFPVGSGTDALELYSFFFYGRVTDISRASF